MANNVYRPKGSRNYHLRVTIDGKEYRQSLRTTSQRVAEKRVRERIEELKGKAASGETDWLFHAGFSSFYDSLGEFDADHGWSEETRERYRTSLRQIGLVLTDIFRSRGEDIEQIGAWEIDVATVAEFVAMRKDDNVKIAIERLREGWSVYRVQRYIGHGSVKTTERYYFRYLSQEQQESGIADGNAGL